MTTRSSPVCRGSLAMLAVCLLAAMMGCHAIVLRTPEFQPTVSAEREASMEGPPACPTVDLYAPSLPPPVPIRSEATVEVLPGRPADDLYAPSLPPPVPIRSEASVEVLPPIPTVDLYAPSILPEAENSEVDRLAGAKFGYGGLAIHREKGRRLGMFDRPSIYAADADSGMLLYDIDFDAADSQPDENLEPPRELSKVSLPTYRIEAPDVLQIEAIKLVPLPPYRIETYDVLQIRAMGTILDQPIDGYFLVEGEGFVSLGPAYGVVRVAGMTIEEATGEITKQLKTILQQPNVTVQLARSAGTQQINGTYVVQPDGMVNLRRCGMVHVEGKTVIEAKQALERQIAQYYDSPQVAVSVAGYNSKNYYVIILQTGVGDNIQRFPVTGNETVLDAFSRIERMSTMASKTMWVSRPAPGGFGAEQILVVDWDAVSRGVTDTNYQILPGDRLFIVDDKLVAADRYIAKFTQPIERMLNISILGTSTTRNMQTLGRAYNQFRRGH